MTNYPLALSSNQLDEHEWESVCMCCALFVFGAIWVLMKFLKRLQRLTYRRREDVIRCDTSNEQMLSISVFIVKSSDQPTLAELLRLLLLLCNSEPISTQLNFPIFHVIVILLLLVAAVARVVMAAAVPSSAQKMSILWWLINLSVSDKRTMAINFCTATECHSDI